MVTLFAPGSFAGVTTLAASRKSTSSVTGHWAQCVISVLTVLAASSSGNMAKECTVDRKKTIKATTTQKRNITESCFCFKV